MATVLMTRVEAFLEMNSSSRVHVGAPPQGVVAMYSTLCYWVNIEAQSGSNFISNQYYRDDSLNKQVSSIYVYSLDGSMYFSGMISSNYYDAYSNLPQAILLNKWYFLMHQCRVYIDGSTNHTFCRYAVLGNKILAQSQHWQQDNTQELFYEIEFGSPSDYWWGGYASMTGKIGQIRHSRYVQQLSERVLYYTQLHNPPENAWLPVENTFRWDVVYDLAGTQSSHGGGYAINYPTTSATIPSTNFCAESMIGFRDSVTGLISNCSQNCSQYMEYCKFCISYSGQQTSFDTKCYYCDATVANQTDVPCECGTPGETMQYTGHGQVCSPCTGDYCYGCHMPNMTCTTCQDDYYWHAGYDTHCKSTCPAGYYGDDATTHCLPCNADCITCTGGGTNECSSCPNLKYLNATPSGSCVDSPLCPTGTLANTQNNICDTCVAECTTCNLTPYNCTGCAVNYYLLGEECVMQCPDGKYKYVSGLSRLCQNCTTSCETCTNATYCNKCQSGYFRQDDGTCVTNCTAGTFESSTDRLCLSCNSKCTTCSGSEDNCSSCASGYFLNGTRCQDSCPMQGYFKNTTGNICTPCDASCFSCEGDALNCTLCPDGVYQSGNTCLTSCASNQFEPVPTICVTCHAACAKCTNYGSDHCQECVAPNFLYNTTCGPSCPPAHFQNTLTRMCEKCTVPCTVCTDASTCTTCSSGFSLNNGQCNGDVYLLKNSSSVKLSLPVNSVNLDALPTSLHAFTFEAWFQSTESTPSTANSVAFGLKPWKFKRDGATQIYNLVYKDTLSFCLTGLLPGLVWQQVAFSLDPVNGLQCYITGRPQTVGPTSKVQIQTTIEKLQELTLGFTQYPFGSETIFIGLFRELRYWNILRTESDINNFLNVQFDPGLVPVALISYWRIVQESIQYHLQDYAANGPIYDSSLITPSFVVSDQFLLMPKSLHICGGSYYLTYVDQIKTCLPCHSDCISCTGPLNTQCTRCGLGKFYDSNSSLCVSSCGNGNYQDSTLNRCSACNPNCLSCTNNPDNCQICQPQKFRQPGQSSCFDDCQAGYYGNRYSLACYQEPTLNIKSPLNGSQFLSSEFISIKGEVFPQNGEDVGMFTGKWKVLRVSDGLDVGSDMVKSNYGDTTMLEAHLDRNVFEVNNFYKIQFSIKGNDTTVYTQIKSIYEIVIMIGDPPQNGSCVSNLTHGKPRLTTFNLSAPNWVDIDGIAEYKFFYSADQGKNYFPIVNQISSQSWISHLFPIFYSNTSLIVRCEVVDFYGFSSISQTSVELYLNESQMLNLPLTSKVDLDSYTVGTVVGTHNFMRIANDIQQMMQYFGGEAAPVENTTMRTGRQECDGSTCNLKGECVSLYEKGDFYCKCNTGYSGKRCQVSDYTSFKKINGLQSEILNQFDQKFDIDLNPQYSRHFVQLMASFPDLIQWNSTTILTSLIKRSVQQWGSKKQSDQEVRSTMQAISSIMDAIWVSINSGNTEEQLKTNMKDLTEVLDDLAINSIQNMGGLEYKKQFTTPNVAVFMHRITKESILKINSGNVERKQQQNLIKVDTKLLKTVNLPEQAAILTREWVRNPYELYDTSVSVPMVTADIVNTISRTKINVNSSQTFKMELSIERNVALQQFSKKLNRYSTLKKDHKKTRADLIAQAKLECVYFNHGTKKWTSEGCSYELLTDTHLICKCSHMSDFSGVFVPIEPISTANGTANTAVAQAKKATDYIGQFPTKLSGWPVVVMYLFMLFTTLSTAFYKDKLHRFNLNLEHQVEDLQIQIHLDEDEINDDPLNQIQTSHESPTKLNQTSSYFNQNRNDDNEMIIYHIPTMKEAITIEFNKADVQAQHFLERVQIYFMLVMNTQVPFTYIMRTSNLIARYQQVLVYYSGIAFRIFMVYMLELSFVGVVTVNIGGVETNVDGQSIAIGMIIPINLLYQPLRFFQVMLIRPSHKFKVDHFLNYKLKDYNYLAKKASKKMVVRYMINTVISVLIIFGMLVSALLCSLFWSFERSKNFTVILVVYLLIDVGVGIGFNILYQSSIAALSNKFGCLKWWYIFCERQRRYRSFVP